MQTLAGWSHVHVGARPARLYSYVASVLPVWTLLQPRDYVNSLQLLTALGLILAGLVAAAVLGGAPAGARMLPRPALDTRGARGGSSRPRRRR